MFILVNGSLKSTNCVQRPLPSMSGGICQVRLNCGRGISTRDFMSRNLKFVVNRSTNVISKPIFEFESGEATGVVFALIYLD